MTFNPPAVKVHENLQHLHNRIAHGLASKYGISGKEALGWAAAVVDVLQDELGGDRLGSKGVYIPASNHRQKRRDKIKEMMGPAPHSRKMARQVALQLHCSERTVWRTVTTVPLPPIP